MSLETNVANPHYDLLVIGSGQAGNPLASAFFAQGKRVVVIERGAVGGTCVNYGCTPTKTMVASAEVANLGRRGHEFGVDIDQLTVDMKAIVARKNGIVASSRAGNEKKFSKGIDLLRGVASFTGPKQISVALNDGGKQQLTADLIVIDTGLSPLVPDIQGIDSVRHLDNVSIMELDHVPAHLLVLGGGYIGLEFAQMFRRFGSEVTVIQHGSQLLEAEDADVADEVAKILREDGIDVLLESKATSAAAKGDQIALTVECNGSSQVITGTDLLIATGRKPNTKELNLPAAGLKADEHGYIPVNERLETGVAGVYAVGDVKGGPAFTHISYDDFRVLKANLLDGGDRVTTNRPVPYCVFLDPQLGRIGLSENAARKAGRNYKVATLKMSSVARALRRDRRAAL